MIPKNLIEYNTPSPACGKLVDDRVHGPGTVRREWAWWQAGSPPPVSTSSSASVSSTGYQRVFPHGPGCEADDRPVRLRLDAPGRGNRPPRSWTDRPECWLAPRWGRSQTGTRPEQPFRPLCRGTTHPYPATLGLPYRRVQHRIRLATAARLRRNADLVTFGEGLRLRSVSPDPANCPWSRGPGPFNRLPPRGPRRRQSSRVPARCASRSSS